MTIVCKRVASTALVAGLWFQSMPAVSAAFPDMAGEWYRFRDAVDYLQQTRVLQGYPDGTFRPHQPINRAEFLKIVFKGRSDIEPIGRRCFSDVNPDEWYAPYVCAAQRRGIVKGYSNGTFKPAQTINTAEALKILLNAYSASVQEISGEHWYRPYVEYLDSRNILGQHIYRPGDELTRLQAADILWRLLRFEEDGTILRFSEGCGKAQPSSPPANVLLTLPSSYVEHDPAPLIVAFHGRTNTNEQVRQYYGLEREASDAIIAYPAATLHGNGTYTYGDDEVTSFDALLEQLTRRYCVDMDRIFVVGHSLGGWFANNIGCIRGGIVRASASVGSSGFIGKCSGPAAAMLIHNPRDTLAPISGSITIRNERMEENNCSQSTHPISVSALECIEYEGCSINPVRFCAHHIDNDTDGTYYPHNWPRSAAREIWTFFEGLQ